jgi:hypothetical protein
MYLILGIDQKYYKVVVMKNFILTLACIAFVAIIGAAVYEHLTMVPKWSAAPPASLSMFQGVHGLNSAPFWIPIHPVTLVLLIVALIVHFRTPRKKSILISLGIYVVILITTFIYFVPELMAILHTPFAMTVDAGLQSRAERWEVLSLVRLAVLLPTAYVLLSSLTKPMVYAK